MADTPSPPLSRQEARAQGLKVYQSRRSCQFGHGSIRTVSRGLCVGCREAAQHERDRIRSTAAAALKAQLRAQVVRELARDKERQTRADERARQAEAKKHARALAAAEQQEASRRAARAAALAEQHRAAQEEARARFHAIASGRHEPLARLANQAPAADHTGDAPPWE